MQDSYKIAGNKKLHLDLEYQKNKLMLELEDLSTSLPPSSEVKPWFREYYDKMQAISKGFVQLTLDRVLVELEFFDRNNSL